MKLSSSAWVMGCSTMWASASAVGFMGGFFGMIYSMPPFGGYLWLV
jgi:hypothetical protein